MAGFVIPLVTGAGKALISSAPALAQTGLVTGALGMGIGRGGRALGLPGTSVEDIAGGETYSLEKDKVTSVGLDDSIRNFFLGTSQEEINEAAKKEAIDQVNRRTKGDRLALLERSQSLGGTLTGAGLQRQEGETTEDVRNRLLREGKKLDVLEYQQLNKLPVVPGQSMAAAIAAKTADDKASPLSPENRYVDQLAREQAQRQYQNEVLAYNERKADAQLAFQQEQAALNRKENLQMRMFDRQDARADRQAADRRADRKDRQALILQMMQGLSTLGASMVL